MAPSDGSGNYSLPAGYLATTGNTIVISEHNPIFEDVAAALSARIMASGVRPMTGPLKLADGAVGAPALTLASNPTWGLYKTSTGWGLSISGTLVFEWTPNGLANDFAINTNKFTVAAASGNTLIAGTLTLTGDFAINTNKFTVAASSGNTVVAGTLGVTGAATLSSTLALTGNLNVNTNKFTVSASSGNTLVAGTLDVTGVANLNGGAAFAGAITTSSGGIGYKIGAGGTVTQATNKTTGVTLDKLSGNITMASGIVGNQQSVSFTLTNSTIAATDILIFNHISVGTIGAYTFNAVAAAGSASISVTNNSAGAINEQIVFRFAVIKAVTS